MNCNLRLWHLLLAALGILAGWAYAASPPLSKVPFVGYPSRSMGTPVAAPHRAPRIVAVEATIAARIAYYARASQYWPGAYAPRGWHCRVWSGANGSFMVVTPEPPPDVNPPRIGHRTRRFRLDQHRRHRRALRCRTSGRPVLSASTASLHPEGPDRKCRSPRRPLCREALPERHRYSSG